MDAKVVILMARLSVLLTCMVVVLATSGCQPEAPSTAAVASGLRLHNLLGDPNQEGFARAEVPREFVFPVDHGPHNQYRSEWWYLTAVLEDDRGREYGLHFTQFRQSLVPMPTGKGPWHTGQAYLGHLAVTDVASGVHLEAERFARGHPDLAGVISGTEFSAVIEDWSLKGSAMGPVVLSLSASEPDQFGVDLQIKQKGPIVLQGDRGLSEKGPGSASYYYSIPRLQIEGTLKLSDRQVPVTGLGWLDREWSTSVLGESLAGWDWFSLQLDDQRSIMVFRLRRYDGTRDDYDHGLMVDHRRLDGRAVVGRGDAGIRVLGSEDFALTPSRYYQDDRGIQWPVAWRLKIGAEEFLINALLDDQTVDLSIRYWEGLVEVRETSGDRLGRGYMELTGYE
ncbi:MAG: lipocalin-like domain-containing protein [Pseudomonadales bacterium]